MSGSGFTPDDSVVLCMILIDMSDLSTIGAIPSSRTLWHTLLTRDVVAGPVAGDVCGLLEAGVGATELHHRYAYEAGGASQGRSHTTV